MNLRWHWRPAPLQLHFLVKSFSRFSAFFMVFLRAVIRLPFFATAELHTDSINQ